MHFLIDNGFSFDKVVRDGLPVVSRDSEAAARVRANAEFLAAVQAASEGTSPVEAIRHKDDKATVHGLVLGIRSHLMEGSPVAPLDAVIWKCMEAIVPHRDGASNVAADRVELEDGEESEPVYQCLYTRPVSRWVRKHCYTVREWCLIEAAGYRLYEEV